MSDTAQATAVDTTYHRDVPVLAVIGEVDSTSVEPIRAHLLDRLDRSPARLVLDLTGVSYFGSTGLQLLTEAIARAEQRGTILAVAAHQRAVLTPMQITALDREVAVCDTVEQAAAAVLSR
ncbi:STAS domain-containing protein [Saccharothrix texasensis]|uniref:Anti-sigma factor antagonist n=1 Tax=Saccharothrix texasensis TaxID=103734 RepID=A0A3N1HGY6_9PSEU|nr:STAS domain-containing protein [Saccharothrix texasensis]ROP41773.1 anti-anti-sigma factor [Saccharothrix texasensis]